MGLSENTNNLAVVQNNKLVMINCLPRVVFRLISIYDFYLTSKEILFDTEKLFAYRAVPKSFHSM